MILIAVLGHFLMIFGAAGRILFSESEVIGDGELACCQDDLILSCDQINVDVTAVGSDELELASLDQVVKLKGMIGENGWSYGNEDLDVILSYNDAKGSLYGHINDITNGASHVIEYCDDLIHVIKRVDVDNLGEDFVVDNVDERNETDALRDEVADFTTIVTYTVKVYYTPHFERITPDVDGYINLLIQATNQGYINSLVPLRLKLLCSEMARINDQYDGNYMLDQFESYKGTYQALRGTADTAILLVGKQMNYCGLATGVDMISSGRTTSIVHKGCALSGFTFGHELGHVIGLTHNREESKNHWFDDGHGHLISRGYASEGYRTILAYQRRGHIERVNYYSNPNVILPKTGTPTGVRGISNNARVLTVNRFALAAIGDESDAACGTDVGNIDCAVANGYRYWEYNYIGNMFPDLCKIYCEDDPTCIHWTNHNEEYWCLLYQAKKVDLAGWTTGPDLSKKECNLDTSACRVYNTFLEVKKEFRSIKTGSASGCHVACSQDNQCISRDWSEETCYMHAAHYGASGDYTSRTRYC